MFKKYLKLIFKWISISSDQLYCKILSSDVNFQFFKTQFFQNTSQLTRKLSSPVDRTTPLGILEGLSQFNIDHHLFIMSILLHLFYLTCNLRKKKASKSKLKKKLNIYIYIYSKKIKNSDQISKKKKF